MDLIVFIIFLLILITGICIGRVTYKKPEEVGTLIIVKSNDNDPYMFLELDKPDINEEYVTMKVKVSHE